MTAVCITGMHRSGTSMVTGWLASCGLPVDHGRLLGPGKANPKGHFEDLDFVDLQAVVVSRNDPDSLGWKVEEPVRLSFDEAERATAEQLLAERNAAYPAWAWKDPRSLHFLDEWLAVDPSIRVIMLWRPAADVAASLRRREAIGPPGVQLGRYDPLRMWTASNQLAVDWKRAHPDALLLSLDDVVADDRRAFDLIGLVE